MLCTGVKWVKRMWLPCRYSWLVWVDLPVWGLPTDPPLPPPLPRPPLQGWQLLQGRWRHLQQLPRRDIFHSWFPPVLSVQAWHIQQQGLPEQLHRRPCGVLRPRFWHYVSAWPALPGLWHSTLFSIVPILHLV